MTTTAIRPPTPGPGVAGPPPARPPAAPGRPPGLPGQSPADRLWVGPTLVAALSVLAGASALSATITGSDWVVPLIEVIGVIWLLGIGCRLLRAAAPITVLVQFAGLMIALTGLFTTSGWGGFIPNARAVQESGELLSGAWKQILGTVPPAPATVELSFLICLTIGTTALIVDFLVAEARSPALVALPLLCLYSVPASIATELLPWWTFALPAALYALLLAMTGHIGARSRGRTNLTLIVSAVVIAAVGTATAVVVGDSVTGIGTEGRLPRNAAGGASQIGLSPFTSLRGDLQRSDPVDLMRISGLPRPDYLRTVGLEKWVPGENAGFREPTDLADNGPANGTLAGVDPGGADPVPIQVRSLQMADKFLPIYGRTVSASGLAAGWVYDARYNSIHREAKLNPGTYSMRAAFPLPSAADLRTDSVSPDSALTDTSGVPESVRQQAKDVTSNAPTPFDKADALRKYFTDPTNGFTYSLQVPRGTTGDPLSDFLEMKQGYCEQYATTMAVMLRTLGIPARVAVGYTQGTEQRDGSYLITTNDAHAWVEVKFDSHGWVRFDPTPLGGGLGNEQGFDEAAGGAGAGTTETTATTTESLSDTPRGNAQDADTEARGQAADTGQNAGAAADEVPTSSGVPAGLWWTVAVLILLALLLAAPSAVRRIRRRRRLSVAGGGGPGAASAAWAEVEDMIVDHGLPLHPTESTRATANRLARTSRLTENARHRLRDLVIAAEQEWYSDRPGHSTADGKELVAAVSALGESLDRSAPRSVPDRLLPRSIRPSSRD
ncbi:transglutaminase family protein [Nakamurella lactea]|uniref:transglutaminase family protein n=1 Tax=Nakamurella lactea TaxID=459515 RepID=UPI0003FDB549|nr:DUF3488 and transglutaminase-like domain-containing protein [Nakamurella lactea]